MGWGYFAGALVVGWAYLAHWWASGRIAGAKPKLPPSEWWREGAIR